MEDTTPYLDKIFSLYEKYIGKVQAEGAWCGHVYAQTYLADIYDDVKKLLSEYVEKYKGKYTFGDESILCI